jgi:hypothetical protein
MFSHVLMKLNNVTGGLVGGWLGPGLSKTGKEGISTSLVSKLVCFPFVREIPPPIRLCFVFSRACLNSLNENGDESFAIGESDDADSLGICDSEDNRGREDKGLSKSLSF